MRPLILNNEGSEKLTDFQVKCVLTSSDIPFEKLRADKQDLLFVDNNNEPIPYWIEKADNMEIIVWLKFSEIPPGKEVFWLYYGNGNFSGASDASETFIRVIDGLVASWHFDEESGNIAYDSSGNDNDGTIYGATRVDGKFGKALQFDGVDDYVEAPDSESLHITKKLTIAMWVKFNSLATKMVLCSKFAGNADDTHSWLFWLDNTYSDELRFYPASDTYKGWTTDANLQTGTWYHIVAVYDGDGTSDDEKLKIYVNGEAKTMDYYGPLSSSLPICDEEVHLGYDPDNPYSPKYLDGIMDEVLIFNAALNQTEILDLYNNYGYTATNYPGKVLVTKYKKPEPIIII